MLRTPNFHLPIPNRALTPVKPHQTDRPKLVSEGDRLELSNNAPMRIHFQGAMASQKLREGCIGDSAGDSNKVARPWQADCVKQFIKTDDTPHVGNIPEPLLKKSGLSEPDFLQGLDQLALHLSQANGWQKLLGKLSPNHQLGDLRLRVKKIGEGFYNRAYKVSIDNEPDEQAYVLKIRKNKPIARLLFTAKSYNNSIYHDAGLGLFLTHHKIHKDVARHYAANPANPKAAWLLGEFIPKNTKASTREGLALYTDIPAWVSDDRPGNRVGYKSKAQGEPGILCDLGDPWKIAVPLPGSAKGPAIRSGR